MLQKRRKVNSLYSSEIYTDFERFKKAFQKERLYVSRNFICDMAFKGGNLSVIKFLQKQLETGFDKVLFWQKGLKESAAYGHFNVFVYFYEYDEPSKADFMDILYASSSRNHFTIIDWLIQREDIERSYWSIIVRRLAADKNVESIKKLFERNIEVSEFSIEASFSGVCEKNYVDLAELFRQRYPFKLIYSFENGSINSFTFVKEEKDESMFGLLYCLFYHNCHYFF